MTKMNQKLVFLLLLSTFITLKTSAQENFQKYFDECNVSGSTTIFDYKNRKWFYTDSTDALVETLPASTFKILNSLIALETKAVADENEILKWDGKDNKFLGVSMPSWNKDTDLKTAYKNSTIWFYVELARKIGRKKYKKVFKEIQYGNLNFKEKGTDFWNYGNFGISPKNQVEFLIKLYENQLPFSQESTDVVKEIMISEENDMGIFRDKTGWTQKNSINIGWWIGYLTTANNIYFFATRITSHTDSSNKDFSSCRKTITKGILKGIIKHYD